MPSVSLKRTSACLSFAVALGASFSVHAAGLGNLTVLSALGQPLRAEIEVVSPQPGDPAQISVRLAAPEYYERAGVQYSSALAGLRFRVDRRSSGQTMIEVSSSKPMDEPYVDMLVQIESPSGALIRRFVFLLDPLEYVARAGARQFVGTSAAATQAAAGSAAPVTAPVSAAPVTAPVSAPVTAPAPAAPVTAPASDSARAPAAPTVASSAAAATARPAPEGDAPAPSTDDFADGTLRGLHSPGSKPQALRMGTAGDMAAGLPVASYTVKAGDTLGGIANALHPPGVSLTEMQSELVQLNPAAFSHGNVNVLLSGATLVLPQYAPLPGAPMPGSGATLESLPAGRSEQAAGAMPAGGEPSADASAAASAVDQEAAAADQTPVSPPARAPSARRAANTDREYQEALAQVTAMEAKVAQMKEAIREVDEQIAQLEAASPVPAAPIESHPIQARPAPAPVAAAAPSRSWLDAMPDLPVLPLAGAGAALLGAFGLRWRRRRVAAPNATTITQASHTAITQGTMPEPAVAASHEGNTVSAASLSTLDTNFSQAGIGEIDTEDIDPVAEADVYMAYGRDAQAEEILKEALRKDPARDAVNVKLLEIYAGRNDVSAFNALATSLHSHTHGQGADWERVAALGRELDADNPMYTASAGDADPHSEAGSHDIPVVSAAFADGEADDGEIQPPAPLLADNFLDIPLVAETAEPVRSAAPARGPRPLSESLDIDLNLDEIKMDGEPSRLDLELPATASPPPVVKPTVQDEPKRGRPVAITSKLQLAEAYRDIGDHDGAKELLGMVIEGGNTHQREHAQKIMEAME